MSDTVASRESLLSKRKRRYVLCPLPAAEETVRIQSITERERMEYDALATDDDGNWDPESAQERVRQLLVRVFVDADGKRLFDDTDTALIAEMDGGDMALAYKAARQHCGFDLTVAELKKN